MFEHQLRYNSTNLEGSPMFRSACTVALLLGSLSLAPADSKKSNAVTHTSDLGRYQVKLPSSPKSDTKEYATKKGVLAITTEKCEVARDLVLSVAFADYPLDFGAVAPKAVLDGIRDGLKEKDGKVTSDTEITLGEKKHPGRELRIEAGKVVIRARIFLVGRRVYEVLATGNKDSVGKPEVDQLFQSFTLVP
jgi:hypothetical protein